MAGTGGEIERLVSEWPEAGMTFEELRRISGAGYETTKGRIV